MRVVLKVYKIFYKKELGYFCELLPYITNFNGSLAIAVKPKYKHIFLSNPYVIVLHATNKIT
jgi:hypothetical protein